MKSSDNKNFIEDLKEISSQVGNPFIIFDKKDITLKIDINEVEKKMPKQEFYSKVDAKIYAKTKDSEDIIKMLNRIPTHFNIKLEADCIDKIIELKKCEILIEKLKAQGTKFLHKGIEIEPTIIKNKQDEDDLKNEVKEIEAKRVKLNMDYNK